MALSPSSVHLVPNRKQHRSLPNIPNIPTASCNRSSGPRESFGLPRHRGAVKTDSSRPRQPPQLQQSAQRKRDPVRAHRSEVRAFPSFLKAGGGRSSWAASGRPVFSSVSRFLRHGILAPGPPPPKRYRTRSSTSTRGAEPRALGWFFPESSRFDQGFEAWRLSVSGPSLLDLETL